MQARTVKHGVPPILCIVACALLTEILINWGMVLVPNLSSSRSLGDIVKNLVVILFGWNCPGNK